ncbi:hypothetical protein Pcinc_037911 [Petrolisthes cinctipes]|uniref:Uncharacterized protein n=1 Tax=Petrolisthes cinctipes TaxID=88211 RepID=A0AAE1BVK1_PETCI|nr:hypothetical protein Pcinc_037911 [Petrolisthes cinctipes]
MFVKDGERRRVVAERGEAGHELKEERQVICTEHELAAFSASPHTLPLLTPCLSSHPASPHTLPLLTPCLSSHPASPHTLPLLTPCLSSHPASPHSLPLLTLCLSSHPASPHTLALPHNNNNASSMSHVPSLPLPSLLLPSIDNTTPLPSLLFFLFPPLPPH